MADDEYEIRIKVNPKENTVNISAPEGECFFQSVAIFAGDAMQQEKYIHIAGASADAAWACGQAYVISESPEGGRGLKNFFKQLAARICFAQDPMSFCQEVGAEEVLNKWECPDQRLWGRWDSEDVLIDKQKSEEKKKKAEQEKDDKKTYH